MMSFAYRDWSAATWRSAKVPLLHRKWHQLKDRSWHEGVVGLLWLIDFELTCLKYLSSLVACEQLRMVLWPRNWKKTRRKLEQDSQSLEHCCLDIIMLFTTCYLFCYAMWWKVCPCFAGPKTNEIRGAREGDFRPFKFSSVSLYFKLFCKLFRENKQK